MKRRPPPLGGKTEAGFNEVIPLRQRDTTVRDPQAMIAAWGSAGDELAGTEPGCRLAKIGDQILILRDYAGLSADQAARREEKDKYGQLGYVRSGLNFIRNVPEAGYHGTVDGEVIEGVAFYRIYSQYQDGLRQHGIELP